jgi:hypothetical protein
VNANQHLAATIERMGGFTPEHRDLIHIAMTSHLAFLSSNGVNHSFQMTAARRDRMARLEKNLRSIAKILDDDPLIKTLIRQEELEQTSSNPSDGGVDASILLQILEESTDGLSPLANLVSGAVRTNAITTKRPETEFRERLWSCLAVIYKAATGREAAVTTDPIDNSVRGDFVDLVEAVHGSLADMVSARRMPPASRHELKRFCTHWRDVRGEDEIILMRELTLLRRQAVRA